VDDLVMVEESPVDAEGEETHKQENEPVVQDNAIKEGNKAKCDKCLAPIFRHNHDNFCIKCANAGEIDEIEVGQIATALKCKKCRKAKFRSRHGEFCDEQCHPQETTSTTVQPDKQEEQQAQEIIEEVVQEVVEDLEDNASQKVPKKKKKNKKNKNKNKNKKHHKDEIISITNDVDDNYNTKFATTMIDNAQEEVIATEDEENLGIFGSILKHLIVSNTWGTAN
jgi:hypothetical protein